MSPEEREGNDTFELLIARYLESEKSGQSLDRAALIEEYPELADSLREFFANHDGIKAAVDPTLPSGEGKVEHARAMAGDHVRYFGEYELLAEIARGGMGVVFKARQVNLNRIVALKMILAGQFAGQEDVQRFYTEAEAAAHLDHPGIVPIFEIGEHEGQHYFSMSYVEGVSLAHKIADGPLPPREAAEIVKKVCEAMAYAHDRGVIHRDLKPANVLIDANGQPKVTDFGLAKKTETDSHLTGTGQILGTPAYMPPEQASGKTDVGPRADVYSLGAILYCLLTGRPPFQAASPMDTLLQVLDRDPVAPLQLNEDIPRDLDTISLKCLEKSPDRRYASARDVACELQRFLNGEPIEARPIRLDERIMKWAKRRPAIATLSFAIICLIAAGFGGVTWQWRNAVLARELQSLEAKKLENSLYTNQIAFADREITDGKTITAGTLLNSCPHDLRGWEWHYLHQRCAVQGRALWSPDAEKITGLAFTDEGDSMMTVAADGEVSVWDSDASSKVRSIRLPRNESSVFVPGGRKVAMITDEGKVGIWKTDTAEEVFMARENGRSSAIAINSDATKLALAVGRKIKIWDVSKETEPIELDATVGSAPRLVLSRDGAILACASSSQIRAWDLATGKTLHDIDGDAFRNQSPTGVAVSPDNHRLAVGLGSEIRVWHLGSVEHDVRLSGGPGNFVSSVAFSPDGNYIVSAGVRTIIVWDAHRGDKILTLPSLDSTNAKMQLTFHSNGRRFACAGSGAITFEMPIRQPLQLTDALVDSSTAVVVFGDSDHLDFSPDGRFVIWVSWARAGSVKGILRVVDALSGRITKEFDVPAKPIKSVSASSDGKLLISAQDKGSTGELCVWDRVSGAVLLSIDVGQNIEDAIFSPDGRQIAIADSESVIVLDADSGKTILICEGALRQCAFSPDGSKLASGSGIWSLQRGERILDLPLTNGAVAFRPQSDIVACHQGRSVKLWSVETGKLVGELPSPNSVSRVAFSPDGERILIATNTKEGNRFDSPIKGEVKLHDIHSGASIFTLVESGNNWDVVFDPSGNRIAAAGHIGFEHVLKVWDGSKPPPGAVSNQAHWHERELEINERNDRWFAYDFHLNQLIKLQPKQATNYVRRGQLRQKYGENDEAIADFEKAIETDPDHLDARISLATALTNAERWPKAIEAWTHVIELQSIAKHVLHRARIHEVMKQWDLAAADLTKAIELESEPTSLTYSRRGNAYALLGQWRLAAKDLETVIEFRSRSRLSRSTQNLDLCNLVSTCSLLQLAGEDAEGFRRSCDTLIDQFGGTNDPAVANSVAWTLARSPNNAKYSALLLTLAQLGSSGKTEHRGPTDVLSRATLGAALYRAGKYAESIEALKQAEKLRSQLGGQLGPVWIFMAMAHHQNGNFDQAQAQLEKASSSWKRATENNGGRWDARLESQLLIQEAESLIARDAEAE